MSNIQITDLPLNIAVGENKVFKDLRLDLQFGQPGGAGYFSGIKNNDLIADFDVRAITNSLQNLFNTNRGEKILNPEYGSDVGKYIFEPVSEITGDLIGEAIHASVKAYEPRVIIENLIIYIDPDNNEYIVDIDIIIPALRNTGASLTGKINNLGFTFI